jgi:hypothetical protein
LLKSLGDQVRTVKINEPPGIQFQDLIVQPFKMWEITRHTEHEARMKVSPYWQARILDLESCVARTRLPFGTCRFNLTLTDPIEGLLDASAPWHGLSREYVVTLGQDSGCEPGRATELPTLAASVNAFTRLWLGVRSASGLSWTDDLEGPPELLDELDEILRLPTPRPDWEF